MTEKAYFFSTQDIDANTPTNYADGDREISPWNFVIALPEYRLNEAAHSHHKTQQHVAQSRPQDAYKMRVCEFEMPAEERILKTKDKIDQLFKMMFEHNPEKVKQHIRDIGTIYCLRSDPNSTEEITQPVDMLEYFVSPQLAEALTKATKLQGDYSAKHNMVEGIINTLPTDEDFLGLLKWLEALGVPTTASLAMSNWDLFEASYDGVRCDQYDHVSAAYAFPKTSTQMVEDYCAQNPTEAQIRGRKQAEELSARLDEMLKKRREATPEATTPEAEPEGTETIVQPDTTPQTPSDAIKKTARAHKPRQPK